MEALSSNIQLSSSRVNNLTETKIGEQRGRLNTYIKELFVEILKGAVLEKTTTSQM